MKTEPIVYTVEVFPDRTRWRNSTGQLHREDGPAVEWSDGAKFWCLNGQRHREDGPAIEWAGGCKEWHLNGKCVSEADVMKNHQTIEIDGKQFTMTQLKMLIAKAGA